ncbi:MAG: Gfo/Idh/MocA family oxidoreductase [Ruthenibacterium sp.]
MVFVAVIGVGFIGETHLESWKKLSHVTVSAVCVRNPAQCAVLAKKYACNAYVDITELLAKEHVDIVDICTPTEFHETYILQAAAAHKDIICEKPVTLTMESMDRILDATQRAGVKLMAAHVLRFWPEYRKIKQLYDENTCGKILAVYAHRLAQYPPNTSWRNNPGASGGGLFDLHLHDIDFLIHLFGPVQSIYSSGVKSANGCWDNVTTILKFYSGVTGTAASVFGMPDGYPFSAAFRLVGTNRCLEYDISAGVNLENLNSARRSLILYEQGCAPSVIHLDGAENFDAELSYFADCVENHTATSQIMPHEVKYLLRVLLTIQQSLETGALITM